MMAIIALKRVVSADVKPAYRVVAFGVPAFGASEYFGRLPHLDVPTRDAAIAKLDVLAFAAAFELSPDYVRSRLAPNETEIRLAERVSPTDADEKLDVLNRWLLGFANDLNH